MERKRQREIAAGALAALAVAMVAYNLRTTPPADAVTRQAPRPSSGAGSTGSAATAAAPGTRSTQTQMTEIDLAALQATKTAPQETERNPFRFKPKPPPPPPPLATSRSMMPQPGGPGPGPGPGEPPPPPRIPLKFFGVFEVPGKGLVANLTDGRGVYRGFVGDTIEGRYRIMQIGVESIELAYLDGRGRQTIRKTGQ